MSDTYQSVQLVNPENTSEKWLPKTVSEQVSCQSGNDLETELADKQSASINGNGATPETGDRFLYCDFSDGKKIKKSEDYFNPYVEGSALGQNGKFSPFMRRLGDCIVIQIGYFPSAGVKTLVSNQDSFINLITYCEISTDDANSVTTVWDGTNPGTKPSITATVSSTYTIVTLRIYGHIPVLPYQLLYKMQNNTSGMIGSLYLPSWCMGMYTTDLNCLSYAYVVITSPDFGLIYNGVSPSISSNVQFYVHEIPVDDGNNGTLYGGAGKRLRSTYNITNTIQPIYNHLDVIDMVINGQS